MKKINNLIARYLERNKLYEWVIDDLCRDWEEYDIDLRVALKRKLEELNHGCYIVPRLVYYKDTTDFFDEHYSDIEEIINDFLNPDCKVYDIINDWDLEEYENKAEETARDVFFNKYISTHNKDYTVWWVYEFICQEFSCELNDL